MASRGPARWQRAALNACLRPNSHAARLYRDRVKVADELSRTLRLLDKDSAFSFMEPKSFQPAASGEMQRRYSVCSVYCMAMQAQLDYGWFVEGPRATGRDAVNAALTGVTRWGSYQVVPVDPSTLKPSTRCQCCGGNASSR